MDAFGQLERFLVEAGVEDSWHGKYSSRAHGMILQGGVHVVCKPAEGGHDDQHIKNEAAVWATAKQLDWTNLMGATVVRTLPSLDTGNPVLCAIRVALPDPDLNTALQDFPDEDLCRAAALDIVINMTDRNPQNWLGRVRKDGSKRLVLIDHAFAFAPQVDSQIGRLKHGHPLSDDVKESLTRLANDGPHPDLRALLAPPALEGMVQRAQALLTAGTFTHP